MNEQGIVVFDSIVEILEKLANLKIPTFTSRFTFITRDALRAARVKKRVGYLCRRRVFIFLRRSHKW